MKNEYFRKLIFIGSLIFLFYCASVYSSTEDRRSYNATYHDITSTGFDLKGAVGDPAVGRSISTNYSIDHGLVIDFGQMTITMATSVNFGVLVPLVTTEVTSTIVVEMVGASNGYNLTVKRDSPTSTLDLNGTSTPEVIFPDAIAWNPAGAGNADTNPGNNLSFRVFQTGTNSDYNATWWGVSDASGTAKYAGFPTIMQQIMNCATCNFGLTNTVMNYRATVPASQRNGLYYGDITITALVNI
jgi:hypothetical protein